MPYRDVMKGKESDPDFNKLREARNSIHLGRNYAFYMDLYNGEIGPILIDNPAIGIVMFSQSKDRKDLALGYVRQARVVTERDPSEVLGKWKTYGIERTAEDGSTVTRGELGSWHNESYRLPLEVITPEKSAIVMIDGRKYPEFWSDIDVTKILGEEIITPTPEMLAAMNLAKGRSHAPYDAHALIHILGYLEQVRQVDPSKLAEMIFRSDADYQKFSALLRELEGNPVYGAEIRGMRASMEYNHALREEGSAIYKGPHEPIERTHENLLRYSHDDPKAILAMLRAMRNIGALTGKPAETALNHTGKIEKIFGSREKSFTVYVRTEYAGLAGDMALKRGFKSATSKGAGGMFLTLVPTNIFPETQIIHEITIVSNPKIIEADKHLGEPGASTNELYSMGDT